MEKNPVPSSPLCDDLNFSTNKKILELLTPDGTLSFICFLSLHNLLPSEQVILSASLYKYNKKCKRQERNILITSKAIYNIANRRTIFRSKYKIKRRIDIKKVSAVSVSEVSSEFVIHVPSEYDYRYASSERRDQILIAICKSYYGANPKASLSFFFIVRQRCSFLNDFLQGEIDLVKYTTTEDDKEKWISRIPVDNPLVKFVYQSLVYLFIGP